MAHEPFQDGKIVCVYQRERRVAIGRQFHGVSEAVDAKKQWRPPREKKVLHKSFEDIISDLRVGGTEEGELIEGD